MTLKMAKILTILFLTFFNLVNGQSDSLYIDGLEKYKIVVDSLVATFQNAEANLKQSVEHYKCIGTGGGTAYLYEDSSGTNALKLIYSDNCEAIETKNFYYFVQNKIVLLLRTVGNSTYKRYYKDDKPIALTKSPSKNKKIIVIDNLNTDTNFIQN